MDCDYSDLLAEARNWALQGVEDGWFNQDDVTGLLEVNTDASTELFSSADRRPLVVAFFGGTGVGKSSLLNRLSGNVIARTGVERPTSREVSLYLPESVQIDRLPADFPLESVRIARHDNSAMEHVLWIDTPDIDSIETENRKIALEWMPHVDVLLYVVSPERYRDQKGWKLLRDQGSSHSWIFIMNQKDRGEPGQIEAFRDLLIGAGFDNPLLLQTDCVNTAAGRKADDLEQLKQVIHDLSDRKRSDQLQRHTRAHRYRQLGELTDAVLSRPAAAQNPATPDRWQKIWEGFRTNILKGLEWPVQLLSQNFAASTSALPAGLSNPVETDSGATDSPGLWDTWAQTLLDDALDRLLVDTGADGSRVGRLKTDLQVPREHAGQLVHASAEQSLRLALANPGSALRRALLTTLGAAVFVLPLATISWVAFELFEHFYESSSGTRPYLGSNFAIHSTLLVSISWLLPWFLRRSLQPRLEKIARTALLQGCAAGLEKLEADIDECVVLYQQRRREFLQTGERISARCMEKARLPGVVTDSLVSRTLPDPTRRASFEN